jgi:arsenate reductase
MKPIVLILCTGNSCRSQMAEGFLRKYAGDQYDVQSAGTEPKEQVHPLAVKVMAEAGVDISGHTPKGVDAFLGREAVRHLLIVCDHADASCPRVWPGTFTRTFMPFEDPALATGTPEQVIAVFRKVRDQIDAAMKTWRPSNRPAAGTELKDEVTHVQA